MNLSPSNCGSWASIVRELRSIPRRAYDWCNDRRIWVDFEKKIVNPDIDKLFQKNRPDVAKELELSQRIKINKAGDCGISKRRNHNENHSNPPGIEKTLQDPRRYEYALI